MSDQPTPTPKPALPPALAQKFAECRANIDQTCPCAGCARIQQALDALERECERREARIKELALAIGEELQVMAKLWGYRPGDPIPCAVQYVMLSAYLDGITVTPQEAYEMYPERGAATALRGEA